MKWSKMKSVSSPKDRSKEAAESSFPAFAPVLSDAFEHVKDLPEPVSVPVGTILLEQDAPCEFVYLLRKGLVRLTYVTPEGRETTLGLRSAGWFAGAANVVMNTPNIASVKAVTPCLVSKVSAAEFSSRLMQSARLMRHFVSTLCSELISQSSAQARLMSESAEQRLASFMRERNAAHPRLHTLDALPLLKQMELAQLLSITPEHLSRLLHKSPQTTVGSNLPV